MTNTSVDLSRLHTNQRLLVRELLTRGAQVKAIDYDLELLEVSLDGQRHYLLDRATDKTAYLPSVLAADKHQAKRMLREGGLSVPDGMCFAPDDRAGALAYAQEVGFPLVVKPNTGSHGDLVHSQLTSCDQLDAALYAFLLYSGGREPFIVERHIDGREHRIFMTKQGEYAVLAREPASVLADGIHSLEDLIETENLRRQSIRDRGEETALCPIALDEVVITHLRRQGLTLDSIAPKDKRIQLRLSSNLAQGGLSRDRTDDVHPSALDLARKVLQIFDGLPCVGIDIISADISAPHPAGSYAILEVNANPGLAMHHLPIVGHPRNVAGMLANTLFRDTPTSNEPPTKQRKGQS